jgi:hypothetical protein
MTATSHQPSDRSSLIFLFAFTLHVELLIAAGQLPDVWHVLSGVLCLATAVVATPSDLRPPPSTPDSESRFLLLPIALLALVTIGRAAQLALGVTVLTLVLHPVVYLLDLPAWPGYLLLVGFLLCMSLGTIAYVVHAVIAWQRRRRPARRYADES